LRAHQRDDPPADRVRNDTPLTEHKRFGEANVSIHKAILQAARERDVERVRALMVEHMTDAPKHVKRMKGKLRGRLILDSEIRRRAASPVASADAAGSDDD
jgi:DNA-binding GntR family transcriptional regulator